MALEVRRRQPDPAIRQPPAPVVVEGPGQVAHLKSLAAHLDGAGERRVGPDDEGRVEGFDAGDEAAQRRQDLALMPRQIPSDVLCRADAPARLNGRPADADLCSARRPVAGLVVNHAAYTAEPLADADLREPGLPADDQVDQESEVADVELPEPVVEVGIG